MVTFSGIDGATAVQIYAESSYGTLATGTWTWTWVGLVTNFKYTNTDTPEYAGGIGNEEFSSRLKTKNVIGWSFDCLISTDTEALMKYAVGSGTNFTYAHAIGDFSMEAFQDQSGTDSRLLFLGNCLDSMTIRHSVNTPPKLTVVGIAQTIAEGSTAQTNKTDATRGTATPLAHTAVDVNSLDNVLDFTWTIKRNLVRIPGSDGQLYHRELKAGKTQFEGSLVMSYEDNTELAKAQAGTAESNFALTLTGLTAANDVWTLGTLYYDQDSITIDDSGDITKIDLPWTGKTLSIA